MLCETYFHKYWMLMEQQQAVRPFSPMDAEEDDLQGAIAAAQADIYADLLDRHGIAYHRLEHDLELEAEGTKLIRIEAEDDPIYGRYGGRQIVQPLPREKHLFRTGALIVAVEQQFAARAVQLLEPRLLYGLYQYAEFQETVSWTGTIPVWHLQELPNPHR